MNPFDLFVLGICAGAGMSDPHSGGVVFKSMEELTHYLNRCGIRKWWENEYRRP